MPEKRTVTIEIEVPDWAEFVTLDYVGLFAWEKQPEYQEAFGMYSARHGGKFERIVASTGAGLYEIPKPDTE